MDVTTVELDRTLREHGFRATTPRRVVWDALVRSAGHVTAEELTALVGEDVDQASVYRALALFEELGLARTSRLGDGDAARWEPAHPDEHFHLVCTECGEIDHHVGSLVSQITEHLDEGHGFEVERVELVVNGRCRRCRG
jgi:Fur family transcriptional regulator, ferric uptake regulator